MNREFCRDHLSKSFVKMAQGEISSSRLYGMLEAYENAGVITAFERFAITEAIIEVKIFNVNNN